MKKKIGVLIVIISLLVTSFSFAADEPSSWAKDAISSLHDTGLLREEAFQNYQGNINRVRFVYLAVKMYEKLKGEISIDPNVTFIDTTDEYARKAATIGITAGIGDGRFAPNDPLTREQLAVFMIRTLELAGQTVQGSSEKFSDDMLISSWAKDAVYKARQRNIISGVGGNNVDPKNYSKEEQALIVFNRMYNQFKENLEIHFIDVGQGDSVYICYGDFDMVIDGGDNSEENTMVSYLSSRVEGPIEYVVATHNHADHIGGLDAVIENYEVDYVIESEQSYDTATYDDFMNAIDQSNAIVLPEEDMSIVFEDLQIKIIETGDDYSNTNNNSVIVELSFGDIKMLFTGDAEAEIENYLVDNDLVEPVELFKAAHHGSSTSNTEELMNSVLNQDSYVVISSGIDNSYGHPTGEVVERFYQFTDEVYGTQENDTIIVTTDGYTIDIDANVKVPRNGTGNGTPDSIEIESLDLVSEQVVLVNSGSDTVNLEGYVLVSVVGNQRFTIPSYSLLPGESVIIYSGGGTGDIKWTGSYIWNNDGDSAELYNPDGILIDAK